MKIVFARQAVNRYDRGLDVTAVKLPIIFIFSALGVQAFAQSVIKAEPFQHGNVRLLPGAVADAGKSSTDALLRVDPGPMLQGFRAGAGLPAKVDVTSNEDSLGRYLSAASRSKELHGKIDSIVTELVECQKNRGDGFLSAVPNADQAWNEIRSGNIRSDGLYLNVLRTPWRSNGDLLLGLIDSYRFAGSSKALAVATKFGDWMVEQTRRMTDEHWQSMLVCDYGNIGEALAELSLCAKSTKYLELAKRFYDHRSLDPLKDGIDNLAGLRAQSQTSKLIGLARQYELTTESLSAKAVKFFWYSVVKHHLYVDGSISLDGYFGKPDQLSDRITTKTGNVDEVSDMLKITRHMFQWDPRAEFFDYYERALLNNIFRSGGALASGFACKSSESHASDPTDSIYFHQLNQRLYVNLFVPSEVSWLGQKIRQETIFPNDNKVTLTVASGLKQTYEIALRHPGWAKSPIQVKVNGVLVATSTKPSSYIFIKRLWKMGDKIQFNLPMSLNTSAVPDNPKRAAILYGPVVLAADLGPKSSPFNPESVLGLNREWNLSTFAKDLDGLTFRSGNTMFRPLATNRDNRYAVYFDFWNADEQAQAYQAYQAELAHQRDLASRTIDFVRIGDAKSEMEHSFVEVHAEADRVNERDFRTVLTEGFLDVEMKSDPVAPLQLIVTYWGNERLLPDFAVTANGQQLAMERLNGYPLRRFYEVAYRIPEEASQRNRTMKVEILANPVKTGPSVAEIRLVRIAG